MTEMKVSAREHKRGMPFMPKVDAVWMHPTFRCVYRWLEKLERDRVFCRHDLRHLMDTARIMWIVNLEEGLGIDREVIYAAALLHDVGKPVQYTLGAPHEEVGARLADTILAVGVSSVWGAAMVNAGSTVLDHLPHGSFFHATGGVCELSFKERLKLIPYESLIGAVLTLCSTLMYWICR